MDIKYIFNELRRDFNFEIFNRVDRITILEGAPTIIYDKETGSIYIYKNDDNEILRLVYETFNKDFSASFELRLNRIYQNLSLMVDMARNNVMNLETLKKITRYISLLGYTNFKIYLEDVFEVIGEPYYGYRRGKYSRKELIEFKEYANMFGIEVIPCIQTLAHLNGLKKLPKYKDIFDIDDILLVDEPKTYDLIEQIFKTVKEIFGGTRINLGMDEAHRLGRGKYLDKHEYIPRKELFLKHLSKVLEISKKYYSKPEIWSDMFFNSYTYAYESFGHQTSIEIDKDLRLVYWDYFAESVDTFEKRIKIHEEITENVSLAGATWKWLGFTPNNNYAFTNLENFMKAGMNHNIDEFTVTCWGDDGGETSVFSVLPSISFAANLNNRNVQNPKEHLFKELSEKSLESFLKLDLLMKCNLDFSKYELNSFNRILLYNDPLLGLYDSLIGEDQIKVYEIAEKELNKEASDNTKFSYLFDYEAKLATLLKYKVDLGIKLRKAYHKKDIEEMQKCKIQLNNAINALKEFYESFYKVWHYEAKASGFQVNDMRLGGLQMRLFNAKRKVEDYIEGCIDYIEELEEETLDFFGNEREYKNIDNFIEAKYSYMATNNVNE